MDSYDRTNNIQQRRLDVGSGGVGNATPTDNSDKILPSAASDGFFADGTHFVGLDVASISWPLVRDARHCRAPHHEDLKPHSRGGANGSRECAPDGKLRVVSKDEATEPARALT